MEGKEQEVPVEELYGIARRVTLELNKLPIHQHSAVTEMINVGIQVRNISMQRQEKLRQDEEQHELKLRQIAMQERQLGSAEEQTRLAKAAEERQAAQELTKTAGPTLVPQ
jgi:hypothetical protein